MNDICIVYIDESNILSKTGNSVYVAVYVLCADKDVFSQKIIETEKDLNISYLHWVDMPWKLRIAFAEKIKRLNFTCKVITYKNPIHPERILKDFLFEVISCDSSIFRIIIDGKKSKRYVSKLKTVLKSKGIRLNKIIFRDDKSEPIVRLADFMAGMCRSFYDNQNEQNSHIYKLLRHKIKTPI